MSTRWSMDHGYIFLFNHCLWWMWIIAAPGTGAIILRRFSSCVVVPYATGGATSCDALSPVLIDTKKLMRWWAQPVFVSHHLVVHLWLLQGCGRFPLTRASHGFTINDWTKAWLSIVMSMRFYAGSKYYRRRRMLRLNIGYSNICWYPATKKKSISIVQLWAITNHHQSIIVSWPTSTCTT